jgi:hypothetical protein
MTHSDTDQLQPHAQAAANESAVPLSGALAVDLQDHLMIACNDLSRLHGLLEDAGQMLIRDFGEIASLACAYDDAQTEQARGAALQRTRERLANATTALQFQDIASQLINHTCQRLRSCSDRLANEAFPDDQDGPAVMEPEPQRQNPVAQVAMDGGSVDLF